MSLQGEEIGEEAAQSAAWGRFAAELDAWAVAGRVADFWWRDDDATEPGPRLDRLLGLAGCRPLSLAVIPADAQPALARRLFEHNGVGGIVRVLQHGHAHQNNAPAGKKRAEFGDDRPMDAMLKEIASDRERLESIFGSLFRPVFTPPWNRISEALARRLGEAGIHGLSRFRPRSRDEGPSVVNTHIDILDWRGSRGFAGTEESLTAATAHLAARRTGAADPDEPTGLLTHHRDHDEGCWTFIAAFRDAVDAHPAARWVSCPAGLQP